MRTRVSDNPLNPRSVTVFASLTNLFLMGLRPIPHLSPRGEILRYSVLTGVKGNAVQ